MQSCAATYADWAGFNAKLCRFVSKLCRLNWFQCKIVQFASKLCRLSWFQCMVVQICINVVQNKLVLMPSCTDLHQSCADWAGFNAKLCIFASKLCRLSWFQCKVVQIIFIKVVQIELVSMQSCADWELISMQSCADLHQSCVKI